MYDIPDLFSSHCAIKVDGTRRKEMTPIELTEMNGDSVSPVEANAVMWRGRYSEAARPTWPSARPTRPGGAANTA